VRGVLTLGRLRGGGSVSAAGVASGLASGGSLRGRSGRGFLSTTDDAVPPGRRAFTTAELQRLFDHLDDVVDREHAAGTKRWLPAQRDSLAFKVCYAYGLRRREVTML